ncbi:MAG: hypothetical protein JXB39_13055 [Deltaproteobacteria bacterium]|nr:hypothetical protein [Deltaproteobacteria bacterium]
MQRFLLLFLLGGCTSDPEDTHSQDTSDPEDAVQAGDALALMAAAEDIARVTWPDAVLLDAAGRTGAAGTAGSTLAEDFDTWMLALLANDGADCSSIEIGWTVAEGFAEPIYHVDPYYGVLDEPIPRTMNLGDALEIVEEAGLLQPFNAVSVNTPLWPIADVRYAFSHPTGHVFVDIATGVVTED